MDVGKIVFFGFKLGFIGAAPASTALKKCGALRRPRDKADIFASENWLISLDGSGEEW